MSSVLGVTVGESAVRIVRPIDRTAPSAGYQFQVVDTGRDDPARLAAQTLGVLFQTGVAGEPIDTVGVVYRDTTQADRIRAAMAEQGLDRFGLVSESEAALAYLRATGELCTDTAVFYDLGDSGLTVTVVDLPSGQVLAGRTDTVGGRVFDAAIRAHQLGTNGVWLPDDPATSTEFDAQCREAKEQLSASDAVAVPGAAGLILMSRDTFDPLIAQCVESSARFVRDIVERAGRDPEAIVLLGGGAHIPLVQEVLRSWLKLPLVVPHEPELVLAKGGALLAGQPKDRFPAVTARIVPPSATERIARPAQAPAGVGGFASTDQRTDRIARSKDRPGDADDSDGSRSWLGMITARGPRVSGKQISGAGLAGTALMVVALIGVALGAGNTVFGSTPSDESAPAETVVTTPPSSKPQPKPAVAPAPVTTTTTVEPDPVTTTQRQVPPAPEPPPPPAMIPGLNIPVPVLPTVELPRFELPRLELPGP
ncbi:Hsp70 family protein [Rhodococcus phenolicus]|uniref:Hsp70 family protein n=1 Tax=Rhodococcus phenolicus TaxID=263849 RepID=UPI00082A3C3C|nr:Hsp70 family protein [Rhodococcus phenolicus]